MLAGILEAAGHHVQLYDPFFYPDTKVLNQRYHFITCTEAIEHFHSPATELARLDACLENAGWLCVMTKRVISAERFANWHYKNDPTHVSFFSDETFYYIGRKYGYKVHLVSADVVLMHKQSYTTPL
ncbi:methyltransferase domain-containing protein [Salinimonas marina]|uniref:methyltransferase domain-containing protein n=1 Tax=Salinimonas marina TaxID=2785918 RepID=UPI001E3F730B|nr:methyltransferase domain-containing protein [Salinimonas marina]